MPEFPVIRYHEDPNINANSLKTTMEHPSYLIPTRQQLGYAHRVFSNSFGAAFDGMEKAGQDKFDLIRIDGKTVNELYAKNYAGLNPRDRSLCLEAQVVAAGLFGRKDLSCPQMETVNGKPAFGQAQLLMREGTLHEPEEGIGKTIARRLGFSETLTEKFAKANERAGLAMNKNADRKQKISFESLAAEERPAGKAARPERKAPDQSAVRSPCKLEIKSPEAHK